jgi:4-amino-4-deoxy-L-arabinose transferase-like glycosyltransferase
MKKFWEDWRLVIIFGTFILLLGLGLRLYNLTLWPVFGDEAIYIRWAQIMNAEPTLRFLPLSDGKQPLFHWILMFMVRRFSDPLFIGRLVSVVTGIGTMIGIFALTYLLFKNKTVALVASAFWAISPYALFFDRMALVGSMLTMFGVLTLVFGILMARTRRLDMAMLTGFALGFAMLTKSPAIFFIMLLPTTWFLADLPKKNRVRVILKLFILSLISFSIAFVMYNLLRLGPNFHLLSQRTGDYVLPISHLWENPKDPFIFHFHRALQWIWAMGPWPVFGLAVLGVLFNFKKSWRELLVVGAWWLVPTLTQAEFAKVFTARYELFTIPFLFTLAATAFLTKNKKLIKLTALFLILFAFLGLRFDYLMLTNPEATPLPPGERAGYLEEWTSGTGIREAAEIVKAEHAEESEIQIVVGTEGYFGTLPDGLQMYLEGIPNVVVIGVGLDISEIPESLAESVEAGNKTYLVANSSRLKFEGEFEDNGLKVVASWEKALRRTDSKDFLRHGPRDTFYLLEVTKAR